MIDVVDVQEALRRDPELIIAILENLGYEHIRDRGEYITFPNLDGDNMGACCIYKNTLNYNNFSRGDSGNIFSLVMDKRECSFPRALRSICTWTGIVATENKVKISKPFGGFYEHIGKNSANGSVELPKYDERMLPDNDCLSKKFLDDGIDLLTQEKWGVRFCHDDNCILIPIRDANGRLVGCKARNNDSHCTMDRRWWAWLPYQKTGVVYGLGENFGSVAKKKTVLIFESEKSVLQCASFGCHLAVAIAGHTISDTQARYIKGLMADTIIIAFDEGIDRYELEENAKKVASDNPAYQNRVGYIYDKTGLLLPKGGKNSPSDLGRDVFEELVKHNILWTETEE